MRDVRPREGRISGVKLVGVENGKCHKAESC
jgi:hypothetical protein